MSKVKLLKIWLCIGMLFAFLSGGTMSWFLNSVLHRLEALPENPEASDSWLDRFSHEMELNDVQIGELSKILDEWQEARLGLQMEYQPRFKELNKAYDDKIVELLDDEQRTRYQEGN